MTPPVIVRVVDDDGHAHTVTLEEGATQALRKYGRRTASKSYSKRRSYCLSQ